jgi:hypothetical protein
MNPRAAVATVTRAVPVFPSEAAVIVEVPTVTPVARPVAETVATASSLDDQVIERSVRVAPSASFAVACS